MTPYQRHRTKWTRCDKCALHTRRRQVVLARGIIPCDVLFIGEAPGVSEDVLGVPFVGPAGKLFDEILGYGANGCKCCLTNLVGCYPREAKKAGSNEPPKESIIACAPRLRQFVGLCRPKVVVRVGALATAHTKWIEQEGIPVADVIHPAAILRLPAHQKGLAIQRVITTVRDVIEEQV